MPVHVLLVEDDELLRSAIARVLESESFVVSCAEDGSQALALLQRNAADPVLIILDLAMPVVDGWDFLRTIREDAQLARIPILVTTGVGRSPGLPDDIVLLRKPFGMPELLREVRRALERPPGAAAPR